MGTIGGGGPGNVIWQPLVSGDLWAVSSLPHSHRHTGTDNNIRRYSWGRNIAVRKETRTSLQQCLFNVCCAISMLCNMIHVTLWSQSSRHGGCWSGANLPPCICSRPNNVHIYRHIRCMSHGTDTHLGSRSLKDVWCTDNPHTNHVVSPQRWLRFLYFFGFVSKESVHLRGFDT